MIDDKYSKGSRIQQPSLPMTIADVAWSFLRCTGYARGCAFEDTHGKEWEPISAANTYEEFCGMYSTETETETFASFI